MSTQNTETPKQSSYDIVIVGGAIMGSSAAWFLTENSDFNGRVLVVERDSSYSAWAQYTIRVPDRDNFTTLLKQRGIPTAVHYPLPLYQQPAVFDASVNLPNSNQCAEQVVSLPVHAYMKPEELDAVTSVISELMNNRI